MKKYAILDIGTNSIKFFLFSIENGKSTTIIDSNKISRLGEGLIKTGIISEKAMDRNIEVLREFLKSAEEENVKEITAVGTMCLRSAKNSDVFLKKAKDELGLIIKVIPGEEEARLSYLAVLSTIGNTDKKVVVFDTGGGSTEFIFGRGIDLNDRISLNLGAVHPTEEFLNSNPVTNDELKTMQNYMMNFFSARITNKEADYLIGIGGTVTSMGAVMHKMVEYNPKIIQGSQMTLEEVKNQIELYKNKTIEERKQIPGLQPKRADVILAGAEIINTIMKIFKIDSFTISDRGLRHGLMFDKYLK
ncbi:MAG: Ppx/GppA phosphatase family protein [Candidatus Tenebribacter mawsonii]|nr:Ppx/GppA phosphatase family protein [Candidatus Tenebribacter mawsonii]